MNPELKFECKNARRLIGFTVVGTIHTPDSESFGLMLVSSPLLAGKTKRLIVWVDRDAEGNGAGHLEIEEEATRRALLLKVEEKP